MMFDIKSFQTKIKFPAQKKFPALFMYDTFHKQRAISIPNWSDAKILQNIDIYGPHAFFAFSHIIGGHKKLEKATKSPCFWHFIGLKSPQNTLFLTLFLCHMQNSIFVLTSSDNTNTNKNESKKNINIHGHGPNFHAKLES